MPATVPWESISKRSSSVPDLWGLSVRGCEPARAPAVAPLVTGTALSCAARSGLLVFPRGIWRQRSGGHWSAVPFSDGFGFGIGVRQASWAEVGSASSGEF